MGDHVTPHPALDATDQIKEEYLTKGQVDWLTSNLRKKVKSLSHVWPFATPWTVAYQAPLSMGFSR